MTEQSDRFLLPEVGSDIESRETERPPHQFQPGESGNPAGRRSSAVSVREAVNRLLHIRSDGTPAFDLAVIRGLATVSNNAVEVMAARQIDMACRDPAKWAIGKDGETWFTGVEPEVGKAFERIAHMLDGKPAATLHVTHEDVRTPDEIAADLAAMLAANPTLIRLIERLCPPTIDMPQEPSMPAAAAPDADKPGE